MPPLLVFELLLLCFLILSSCSTSELFDVQIHRRVLGGLDGKVALSSDFKEFSYPQTLDHFNYKPESYKTFNQKYITNSRHWGGASSNSPMFVYLGSEAPLDGQITTTGLLSDNAARFRAYQLYIEHRFYGKSIPSGLTQDQALKNKDLRGYFNSAQALADYAEIMIHVKENVLRSEFSPVIVIGGSYGGNLAAWFRLKYPHIAHGALASSAPILYFEDVIPENSYYKVVSMDFWDASQNCYSTIQGSWAEIDRIASQQNGLSFLSNKFHTCKPLTHQKDLKNPLISVYAALAQYNNPPEFLLNKLCKAIDETSSTDILDKIFAGLLAVSVANLTCYINPTLPYSETTAGWGWQTCSELLIPVQGKDGNGMFQAYTYDPNRRSQYCKAVYGVQPRPRWITTYYGGRHIKLHLLRFGSNIIFSNGLKDPYSIGSVLEDISSSILAVKTAEGAHCLDLAVANKTGDPNWLVQQRETEMRIIEGWIQQYHTDLQNVKPIISAFLSENKEMSY